MEVATIRDELLRAFVRECGVRESQSESILTWGKRYFPDYFELAPGRHHIELDGLLRGWTRERDVRAAIEGPRGCAKSTLLTFLYPIWATCLNLEDYIIMFAQTWDQATKYLQNISEEFESNELLAEDYPNACGQGSEWKKDGIITRNAVRIEALGAGQKVRGRRKKSKRPTSLLVDDPEGDEAAYSSRIRDTIRNWATKGVFKAGGPGTNILIAGTVIHRECLVSHCGQLPGWRSVKYKAITSWPDRMDLWDKWERILIGDPGNPEKALRDSRDFFEEHKAEMEAGAEVLWPELEDLYALMFMRASEGHTSFESEKQNNPIDPSKCEWGPDLFEGDDIWFDEWPENPQCVTMALDPSKGKSDKQGDYQASVSLMVGNDGCLYFDADISRRPVKEMMTTFLDIGEDLQPDRAVVEDVTFQELVLTEIEEQALERHILFPVEGIATGGVNKIARIRRLGPYISRRRIKFKKRSIGAQRLRRQLMDVPNGDFDDGPDAAEMAVRCAQTLLRDAQSGGVEDPR